MSLDAVAALLQLPQSISSAAQGGQAAVPLPPLPARQHDGFQRQDRRQRGENHSQPPSPKRAKTADSQLPAPAPQLVQQTLMLGFPSGPLAAQHQLQGHGRSWQAAGLAQLLGAAASQPPSPRGTPPPGGGSAPASPRQQAAGQQGQHQASLEPGLGGLSEDPAAPGVAQQQLLLALLSMLPEEQRRARPEAAPPAPGPGTPRTTSSDHKAAGTSAAAGGTDSPVSAPHGCLPQRSGQLPLLVSCAASPGAEAAAADAALASAPAEAAAHQLRASAVAAPMPPLPPAPPEAAAAAAAARAGLLMSPQQRQAVFEHSVGVLIWMVQQLQHQTFERGATGALLQQQLVVMQAWAQRVRRCLRQMQQAWRELLAAMQGAVGEHAGQLKHQDAVLQTVLAVQQQLAEALLTTQRQVQQAQQQAQRPEEATQQQQAQQAQRPGEAGGAAEHAACATEDHHDPQGAAEAAGQAQQLAQENAVLSCQVAELLEKQEEQRSAMHQMVAGLLHERQQRQQLQAALAALQERVRQLAREPVPPATAAPAAAAAAGAAPQPAGLPAEHEGPGSGQVADSLARAGSSGALL
ncbi:hypothetical protein ABPG77_010165 [Micractinium sp. CCAP 211/92]